MKTRIILLLILFPILTFAESDAPTIAVLDFADNSFLVSEKFSRLKQGLADVMITALSQVENVSIVERRKLKEIMAEIAREQAMGVDDSTSLKIGNLTGAEYLVLGSFIKDPKDKIRIDCRIVKTETAETVKAEEVTGKTKDILDLMEKLSNKILKNLDIALTKEDEEKMETQTKICKYEVMMKYFRALELLDMEKTDEAIEELDKVIEKCPEFKRAQELKEELVK